MPGDLLLTGATGFVGMELLGRYLERSDVRVITPVRARDDAAAAVRVDEVLDGLFGARAGRYRRRVEPVAADVTVAGLGLPRARREAIADRADQIIHCAASVSFALPLDEARKINLEGTRHMLELATMAHERGGLRRFGHVSTAFVSGTYPGKFHEHDHDVGQDFRNTYERSKFEAERLVRARQDLPVTILRPSIVVGDRRSGWTAAFNVLYWPLRAFARGLFPAVPAVASAPVDVVSVDFVADAIHALCDADEGLGQTYHLTAAPMSSSVAEIAELASRYFDRPPPRVLDPVEFARYAEALPSRQGAALQQSAVYFPYFAVRTEFDNTRTRAQLEPTGISASPLAAYLERLLDFATRTRWGKHPVSRLEALAA